MSKVFTAVINEEDNFFVASNPETGVTSQGKTLDESLANLKEALELYLEELGKSSKSALSLNQHSFLTTVTI